MPRIPAASACLVLCALSAPHLCAQTIVWSTPQPTFSPAEVSTNGTGVIAYHLHNPAPATVNGVVFTGGFIPLGWGGYVSTALQGSTTGDAGYDALLNGARATAAPTGNPTGWGAIELQTLAAFNVGSTYEIQCWYTDQRPGTSTNVICDRVMTLSSAVGPGVLASGQITNLGALVQGPLSGPLEADPDNHPATAGPDTLFGMWCSGTFTWTNPADQLFLLVQGSHPVASSVLRPHLNAFQIRELPPGSVFATASAYGVGCGGSAPLDLTVTGRPIANTTLQCTTGHITPTTPFGALTVGLNQLLPPIDLAVLGMPGCFQYHDMLVVMLYLPFGASAVPMPLQVPNAVGLQLQLQSFNYDPSAALTPLGAVSSNGVELRIGNY